METIGADELAEHIAVNDAFVVDVRGGTHSSQIYGAVRYDPGRLSRAEELVLPLPRGAGLIVLYDQTGGSKTLSDLIEKFEEAGYGTIRALEGGFDAWAAAGGRCEAQTLEQPVPGISSHQLIR